MEEPSHSSDEDDEPFIAYHINDFNNSWDDDNKHLNEKMREKNKRELFKLTPTQIIAIWTVLQLLALICVLYFGIRSFTTEGSGFVKLLE